MSELPVIPSDDRNDPYPQDAARMELFSLYEQGRDSFWIPREINLQRDIEHYESLNEKEKRLLKYILTFFAFADKLVNENIDDRFLKDVPYIEARLFYHVQLAIEDVHWVTYVDILKAYVTDPVERDSMFNNAKKLPVVLTMTEYIRKCKGSDECLQKRLLRMACVEGLFFSSSFCVIYWFQNRGLMPGLGQANELIARDEGLHTTFALKLFNMFDAHLAKSEITEVITEAVKIAEDFICDALPEGLPDMNKNLMCEYIKHIANTILHCIGEESLYHSSNPFGFMEQLNMKLRTNFFERRNSEYNKLNRQTIADKNKTVYDQPF